MPKSPTRKVKARSTTENFPKTKPSGKSPTRKVAARKTTDRVA
jgi:hypothetical protein